MFCIVEKNQKVGKQEHHNERLLMFSRDDWIGNDFCQRIHLNNRKRYHLMSVCVRYTIYCHIYIYEMVFNLHNKFRFYFSVQFSSVAQSCLILCDPVDCSTPGFPVHHQLPGLPMNIQDWFTLWLSSFISLKSKGLSRVFSNTTVQNHQFFSAQLSLWSMSHIHIWLPEKP